MEKSSYINTRPEPEKKIALGPAKPIDYQQKVVLLIAAITILKTITAFVLELGNDEAYYWFYSQDLKGNYFDHPPMVAIWARFSTLNLWLQDYPGFIRMGSILGHAFATWAMYKTIAVLHSEKGGWLGACLYNASFYAGITAGLFVMPDAPQMVFWTLSLWMLALITKKENSWKYWMLFAVAAGLCMMSKVHGVFIYFGLGLFIVIRRWQWLKLPQLYVATIISLLIISPILIWNLQNNFASYRFHSARVAVDETVESLPFIREILQQFLYNNPFNVVLMTIAVVAGLRLGYKKLPALSLFNCIALPLAGALLFVSLFRDATLPHWSGPAYVTLVPAAAMHLAQISNKPIWPRWAQWSLGTFVATLISYTLLVQFYPGTLGKKEGIDLGKGDNTLDVYGWKDAAQSFAIFYAAEEQSGRMPPNAPLVGYKWWAAHVEYYFCRPLNLQLMGLGTLNDLHEYQWMNKAREEKVNLSAAYCIVPSDEYYDVEQKYGGYYSQIQLVKTIETFRGKKPAHNFYVYRLRGWRGKPVPGVR